MSREKAISQIIPVFQRYGYEGATLSRLSQATGLGRSSLYHHFRGGKEEMAIAVLEYVAQWFEEMILSALRTCDEPLERLRIMCQNLDKFYHHGRESCLLNVITFGEGNDLFHQQVQQMLLIWIDQLAQVLIEGGIKPEEAKNRAQEAIILIQGALVLARGLDNTSPFERIIESLPERLLN
ncbi:transcriptional regulator, TetR family [Gloeothece citriformis PCC 7424]|uniref:Transcriptional regulator, TetR family n=1 Tax=Gloeothece citriformis (strain PCC 7424) TaxID=65393 RepID=B7KKI9_GLOC7|nr:TetR/AcrR family transcriptional regulator [Gloeothece citriformis]ACK72322.1 transcriptional regulator, TetR family [Gloeothece citriformis PCC 7424]